MKTKILITGANGQLGKTFRELNSNNILGLDIVFKNKKELDITNIDSLKSFFRNNEFNYCINCAAFTDVKQSEITPEIAFLVNAQGVKNLALICKEFDTTLVHISTDYVFDGKKKAPYLEVDTTNPVNEYGKSKLRGEQYIQSVLKKYIIIRTSWLYSKYGRNFLTTMLKISNQKKELNIVSDQIGSPTYTRDLASVILRIIKSSKLEYGLYHYSNRGEVSWYDFAKNIFNIENINIKLNSIKTIDYKTLEKRPSYSVLNNNKIENHLNIDIPYWKDSLVRCLK